MTFQQDQRRYPRISTAGHEYGIRFHHKGTEILTARVANLSAGGVGLEVQIQDANHLELGSTLEKLTLDHPDLPYLPLSAVVLRMLGKVAGKTSGYVLVGAEFQDITPFVRELIAFHVDDFLDAP